MSETRNAYSWWKIALCIVCALIIVAGLVIITFGQINDDYRFKLSGVIILLFSISFEMFLICYIGVHNGRRDMEFASV